MYFQLFSKFSRAGGNVAILAIFRSALQNFEKIKKIKFVAILATFPPALGNFEKMWKNKLLPFWQHFLHNYFCLAHICDWRAKDGADNSISDNTCNSICQGADYSNVVCFGETVQQMCECSKNLENSVQGTSGLSISTQDNLWRSFLLKQNFPSPGNLTTFFVNTEQILTVFDFGWENPGGRKPTKNVACCYINKKSVLCLNVNELRIPAPKNTHSTLGCFRIFS